MKLKGIFGKGSGKLGNAVFAVSGGEQLVKEYNPRVSNPNTPAQVEQRAKFKLLSQLAANFAPALGFKKKGLTSKRNQFVSANMQLVTFNNNKAEITLDVLQLTAGRVICPNFTGTRGSGGVVNIALNDAAPQNFTGMVYVSVEDGGYHNLKVVDVKVVVEAGSGRTFPASLKATETMTYLYAYGILEVSSEDIAKYLNSEGEIATESAWVVVDELVRSSAAMFSATRSVYLDE